MNKLNDTTNNILFRPAILFYDREFYLIASTLKINAKYLHAICIRLNGFVFDFRLYYLVHNDYDIVYRVCFRTHAVKYYWQT